MFKRHLLKRFNIYLGLFAILLISICPVINQTIALIQGSVHHQSVIQHVPSTNHFECAAEFLKSNGLNSSDFSVDSSSHDKQQTTQHTPHNYDEHSLAKCGYCDLIHAATILTAFYVAVLETPTSEPIISNSEPYLFSLNYWSILSRAPPSPALV